MKSLYGLGIFAGISIVVYLCGPVLKTEPLGTELPLVDVGAEEIEDYVKAGEAGFKIKADNEARFYWADSLGRPTEYAVLYLHGFTASRYEGYPVNERIPRIFGFNAYMPRLYGHGLEGEEVLEDMRPELLYASARKALAVARKVGNKVILMGTSTGATLALMLAADFPEAVHGLILYSPNVEIKNAGAKWASRPWGLHIARILYGGKYAVSEEDETSAYWYNTYRLEAVVYLQKLLEMRMHKAEFAKVSQPLFLGYYYKDEKNQDPVVKVEAALRMFEEVETPPELKVKRAFPDAGAHVIACELRSRAVEEVAAETEKFIREIILHATSSLDP